MAKKTVAAKKRNVKVDANGQLHVHSSFNNIIVSLANSEGQVISWSSAGKMGFRGSKKNTPYAAQMAAQDCAKIAYDLGLRKVKARPGSIPGLGRSSGEGIGYPLQYSWASLVAQLVKNLPSMQETWV